MVTRNCGPVKGFSGDGQNQIYAPVWILVCICVNMHVFTFDKQALEKGLEICTHSSRPFHRVLHNQALCVCDLCVGGLSVCVLAYCRVTVNEPFAAKNTQTHTRTHTLAHTQTHTGTHARTHTRAHTHARTSRMRLRQQQRQ